MKRKSYSSVEKLVESVKRQHKKKEPATRERIVQIVTTGTIIDLVQVLPKQDKALRKYLHIRCERKWFTREQLTTFFKRGRAEKKQLKDADENSVEDT